jgi:GxxExxY protein
MDTDGHGSNLVESNLTRTIIGGSFTVLNALGHGLHEKPYENALVVELRLLGLALVQQKSFDVVFKGVRVGEYIPDLIVEDRVVVDAKVVQGITNFERGQMINYLRITRVRAGLIINFHNAKLEWERIVL